MRPWYLLRSDSASDGRKVQAWSTSQMLQLKPHLTMFFNPSSKYLSWSSFLIPPSLTTMAFQPTRLPSSSSARDREKDSPASRD